MKRFWKVVCAVLICAMAITSTPVLMADMQYVEAKKNQKKEVAEFMCDFAGDELKYPNTVKVTKVVAVKYKPDKYLKEMYETWGLPAGNVIWYVTYKAANDYGTLVEGYVFFDESGVDHEWEDVEDDYKDSGKWSIKSGEFTKKVNKLTKKYIKKRYY